MCVNQYYRLSRNCMLDHHYITFRGSFAGAERWEQPPGARCICDRLRRVTSNKPSQRTWIAPTLTRRVDSQIVARQRVARQRRHRVAKGQSQRGPPASTILSAVGAVLQRLPDRHGQPDATQSVQHFCKRWPRLRHSTQHADKQRHTETIQQTMHTPHQPAAVDLEGRRRRLHHSIHR